MLSSHRHDLLDADIAYYDAYDSAYPIYKFALEVKSDENILKHQRLWSDILRGVYESSWHKSLKL